ncbi:MAG: hypothetical protein WC073_04590 [Sterolibacterium sp.]
MFVALRQRLAEIARKPIPHPCGYGDNNYWRGGVVGMVELAPKN